MGTLESSPLVIGHYSREFFGASGTHYR